MSVILASFEWSKLSFLMTKLFALLCYCMDFPLKSDGEIYDLLFDLKIESFGFKPITFYFVPIVQLGLVYLSDFPALNGDNLLLI